jgi:hypothetical protein
VLQAQRAKLLMMEFWMVSFLAFIQHTSPDALVQIWQYSITEKITILENIIKKMFCRKASAKSDRWHVRQIGGPC